MNKSFLVFAAFILLSHISFSQGVTYDHAKKKAQNHYDIGNNAYAFGHYQEADSFMKLAIESEKNFIDAHWLRGEINFAGLRNYDEAAKEFKIVEQLNPITKTCCLATLAIAYLIKGTMTKQKNISSHFYISKVCRPISKSKPRT